MMKMKHIMEWNSEPTNFIVSLLNGGDVASSLMFAVADVFIVALFFLFFAAAATLIEKGFKFIVSSTLGENACFIIESYLTYPGVVYHELSHALFAFLSGAKVMKISLRRRVCEDGTAILGSVSYAPRGGAALEAFQKAMSSIAPSITGVIGMTVMIIFVLPICHEWWQLVLFWYLFVCLLLHSEMSSQDIAVGITGVPICIVILLVVFLIFPFNPMSVAHDAIKHIEGKDISTEQTMTEPTQSSDEMMNIDAPNEQNTTNDPASAPDEPRYDVSHSANGIHVEIASE